MGWHQRKCHHGGHEHALCHQAHAQFHLPSSDHFAPALLHALGIRSELTCLKAVCRENNPFYNMPCSAPASDVLPLQPTKRITTTTIPTAAVKKVYRGSEPSRLTILSAIGDADDIIVRIGQRTNSIIIFLIADE